MIYFVREERQRSAPSDSGDWFNGDGNVLSTRTIIDELWEWTSEEIILISTKRQDGFDGDSSQTRRVFGRRCLVIIEGDDDRLINDDSIDQRLKHVLYETKNFFI